MLNRDSSIRLAEVQSTGPKAHQENPYLKNAERGAYELGSLLRSLPSSQCAHALVTNEDRQMAEAVVAHAQNGFNTLVWGLEAIGGLMVDLGANPNYELEVSRMTALGDLIQHISVEVQFLRETEEEFRGEMYVNDEKGGD